MITKAMKMKCNVVVDKSKIKNNQFSQNTEFSVCGKFNKTDSIDFEVFDESVVDGYDMEDETDVSGEDKWFVIVNFGL